jgi:hypothetical protein
LFSQQNHNSVDNFLNKLRAKPHAYRMRLVFLVSGVVTGVIAILWLSLLSVTVHNTIVQSDEDISPLSQLRVNVSEFMEGLRGDR